MRLADLEPRYFVIGDSKQPVGITFECPCCAGKETSVRLAIALHMDGTNFDPDPANPQQLPSNELVWTIISGSSFGDISITPSIDASKSGHWHGFITNGEIR